MNQGKICVSVCAKTAAELVDRVRQALPQADVVELRLDCLLPSELGAAFETLPNTGTPYLVTFRPRAHGGHTDADKIQRIKFWSYALTRLRGRDFMVDYEADIDFPLKLDPERTMVSLHDFSNTIDDLAFQFDLLARLTGKTVKIAIGTRDIPDAIGVWKLLDHARTVNKQVIPIAMGEAGKWTRILGLAHGSPITYASLDAGDETAPGQISAKDLRDVFRVNKLDRDTEVYGIIAGDTSYSLSPYMHNAAFKEANVNSVFVPLQVVDLDEFMRRMVKAETREIELNFKGFSVTNPHKQTVMKYLDRIDDAARKIGAVNTVNIENGKLHGFNTDAPGFIEPLKSVIGSLRDARVAVAGAGGASRACIYALKQEGADVTVLARDRAKAAILADEFDINVESLTTGHRPLTTDILVNATPLGTHGENENETIATADELRDVKLVYDLVYNPSETLLLREAKIAGAKTLGGLDMLVAQGAKQFEIWTSGEAPVATMRAAVIERLP